jgi:hypothetical protein
MNDEFLYRALNRLIIPPPDEIAKEKARTCAVLAFHSESKKRTESENKAHETIPPGRQTKL